MNGIDFAIMASFILYFLLIAFRMRQGKTGLAPSGHFGFPSISMVSLSDADCADQYWL